jgi:hypothetical protein
MSISCRPLGRRDHQQAGGKVPRETSGTASAIVLRVQVLDLDRASTLSQIRPCRQQTLVSKVRHQNASDRLSPGRLRVRVTGYPSIKRRDLIAV